MARLLGADHGLASDASDAAPIAVHLMHNALTIEPESTVMIAMLRGVIAQKDDGTAIVDVNGVGYLVQLAQAWPPSSVREKSRCCTSRRRCVRTPLRSLASSAQRIMRPSRCCVRSMESVHGRLPGILADVSGGPPWLSRTKNTTLTKLKGLGKDRRASLPRAQEQDPQTFTPTAVGGGGVEVDPLPLALAT